MTLAWGAELIRVINPNSIGLAVMMPGTALLLALYALGLWYKTKWQSSREWPICLSVAFPGVCSALYM